MKITRVEAKDQDQALEVRTRKGTYLFPYAKLDVKPSAEDPLVKVYVDPELGDEAFTYELESGREGTVHIDHVLDVNQDPSHLADLLLYRLTVEAQRRFEASSIGVRQLARQLGTSPTQLYRLLDTTNYRKSVRKMLALLHALNCEVELVVHQREAV